MTDYTQYFNPRETSQREPIPGSTQVPNSAGGFAWALDDWGRLDRWLLLGADGPTYYASAQALTVENAHVVARCLQADGPRTVARIAEISRAGRAPKNDPAIFALAMAAHVPDAATRVLARAALPHVCRIGTHLFQFAQSVQAFGGWGRGLRRTIEAWYNRPVGDVAYQAIKYPQRNGWTHLDLLRLSHATPSSAEHAALFQWVRATQAQAAEVKGPLGAETPRALNYRVMPGAVPPVVLAMEALKTATTAAEVARLIRAHDLPREAVESADTKWLNAPEVWEALLVGMPMTALIRSLARMTASGLLAPLNEAVKHVATQLADADRLRRARVHPLTALSALRVYAQGHGERSKLTWTPVGQIIDALDAAFYLAYEAVPVTGKREQLNIDVSGSMGTGTVAGLPGLTPRDVAAALALVTAAREPQHVIMAFGDRFVELPITPRQRLDDVIKATSNLPFMRTDCAVPMVWALQEKVPVDAFITITDSETWAGPIHPAQALVQYRQRMGVNARSVVLGMTSAGFSVADPNDGGSLDVVGIDTATPHLIADFVSS